jgi:hypothetical protein
VEPPPPGSGDEGLADLVPGRVRGALAQLVVAFVLYALWRGRRLGRPVPEPQPVQLEGSELVVAVGHLLQRSGDPDRAATVLRRDLHRRLTDRIGLPRGAPAEDVARAAAAVTPVAEGRLLAALAGPRVATEAALVEAARDIEAIRREAFHGS